MFDRDFESIFETQNKADLDKIFDEQVINHAIPFEDYFSDSLKNEFWDSERTLLARINRYKEFCLQPFHVNLLAKYFDDDLKKIELKIKVEILNIPSDRFKNMSQFLNRFHAVYEGYTFTFKPEYVAFFNCLTQNPKFLCTLPKK